MLINIEATQEQRIRIVSLLDKYSKIRNGFVYWDLVENETTPKVYTLRFSSMNASIPDRIFAGSFTPDGAIDKAEKAIAATV